MANPGDAVIPVPLSSGATDNPNAPQSGAPAVPAGFGDTPPAPPAPAGFSDTRPTEPEPSMLSKIRTFAKDTIGNFGAGAMDTVEGGIEAAHKGIHAVLPEKIAEALSPESGMTAEKKIAEPLTRAEGSIGAKIIGYGGENLAEFLLGDEALKSLSIADKFAHISAVAKVLEQSPRLMKALQMGTDVGKAAGELSPEARAAIQKEPVLARLIGTAMDAVRQGAVQGAQTTVKSGGDVKKGVEEGATTAAASGFLGGAFGLLGRAADKAGEAGNAVKTASEMGQAAPTKLEMGEKVADQVRKAEEGMHSDFESGIQNLKSKIGDATTPLEGSPLQQAAANAMEGRADTPSIKKTTLGKAFEGINGGSEKTLKALSEITNPNASGPLTIDELVQRRQQLGEAIGNITKGNTTAENRADVGVYRALRDGIDDTIDKLAKDSGSPEASQDYASLRAAYRDKVNLFKEPIIRSLTEEGVGRGTALDNAGKELLAGKNKLDKISTLEQVIGPQGVKDFGQHIAANVLADASSESGQINPATFVKKWKQIDALSPEVKQKLFDMGGAQDGLTKLSKDLKSAAAYQKLARMGVVGAVPGALTGGWGLALGVLSEVAPDKIGPLLDKVANSPRLWSAFRTAGELSQKAATSPAVSLAKSAAVKGTGSALSNVLQGASAPLSSEDNQ